MQPSDRRRQPLVLGQPLRDFAETEFTVLKAGQGQARRKLSHTHGE